MALILKVYEFDKKYNINRLKFEIYNLFHYIITFFYKLNYFKK